MKWPVLLVAPLLALQGLAGAGGQAPDGTAEAPWTLEDPEGDVHHWLAAEVPAPPSDLFQLIDLTRIELRDENGTAVTLVIGVKDLDTTRETIAAACLIYVCNSFRYGATFTLDGDEDRRYNLNLYFVFIPVLSPDPGPHASMSVTEQRGDRYEYDQLETPAVETDYEANEFRIVLPKGDLKVGFGAAQHPPTEGDALTDLRVQSSMQLGGFPAGLVVNYEDEAPDQGTAHDYEFREPTWNARLVVETERQHRERLAGGDDGYDYYVCDGATCRVVGAERERVGVVAGGLRKVPFFVTNRGDEKRVVNLTATLDVAQSGWNASVVPSLLLGPNETQEVAVLVHAPPDAQHRDGGTLTVEAKDLADASGVGGAQTLVEAVRTPSPADPVLFLHSENHPRDPPVLDVVVPPYSLSMNTLRDDAAYGDAPVPLGTLRDFGLLSVPLDTALGLPLRLDPAASSTLTLTLASELPTSDVTVRADLLLLGETDERLATGTTGASVASSGTAVTVDMRPAMEMPPEGLVGDLLLRIDLGDSSLSVPLFGGVPFRGTLDARGSRLALALLPAAPPPVTTASKRITLHLEDGRDPVEYVNPGEARAFNLTLLNEEPTDVTVQWSVKASDPSWVLLTEGERKATLSTGNVSALRVVARAPLAAEEGEHLLLNVSATPSVGKGETATGTNMTLRVIVTRGIDLPDDAPTSPALKTKSKGNGTPDAGLALGLAAVAAAVLVARRRRGA